MALDLLFQIANTVSDYFSNSRPVHRHLVLELSGNCGTVRRSVLSLDLYQKKSGQEPDPGRAQSQYSDSPVISLYFEIYVMLHQDNKPLEPSALEFE